MTTPLSVSRVARLFRRRPRPPAEILAPYAAAALPLLERAERLYHEWFEYVALVADSEKLANAAAIQRWEAATLARSLEGVVPPEALADAHADLVVTLHQASRASQLLSSGSRYHSASAYCEGQVLLTAARERRLKAFRAVRRILGDPRPAGGSG